MIGGRHNAIKRLGYAIVLVSRCGSLLAFGNGRPPSWITDSAGAECWAYFCVIGMSPFIPYVVTDCLGILIMLSFGRTAATLATRPLARVWGLIFHTLDMEIASSLVNNDMFWMPAHGAASSIGKKLKSNGHPVNAIDWRANRLVDFLARLAACTDQVPHSATKLYRQVLGAAEYFAASLGAVTFAANHYHKEVMNGEGKLVSVMCRPQQGSFPDPRTAHARQRHSQYVPGAESC